LQLKRLWWLTTVKRLSRFHVGQVYHANDDDHFISTSVDAVPPVLPRE